MKLFGFCVDTSKCDDMVFAVVAETVEEARAMIRANYEKEYGAEFQFPIGEPETVLPIPGVLSWPRSFD